MYGHSPPQPSRFSLRTTLLVFAAFALFACSIPFLARTLFAADTEIGLRVEYFQQDSARVIAKWAPGRDAKGQTDSYAVRWASGSTQRNVTKAVTADTFKIRRPAINDSALVTVAVTGIRRGVPSASAVTAQVWVKNPDAPPPPVDSLKMDTMYVAQYVDSSRLDYLSTSGTLLATSHTQSTIRLVEHDTALLVVRRWTKPGFVRPVNDTMVWSIHLADASAPILALTPKGGGWSADTAYMIALDCRCKESGDPVNPPRLDLRRGAYVVRDAYGGVRDVTPVAALSPDPFRE